MLAANPVDPYRVIEISFPEPSGPSVPYPRRSGRVRPLAVAVLATGVLAIAAAAMNGGESSRTGDTPMGKAAVLAVATAAPGEFRLGPGNDQPPGVIVALPGARARVPGEFRLGPGNDQPPGVMIER